MSSAMFSEEAHPMVEKSASIKLASSAPLLIANLIETAMPFLRNIALAHLLAPAEFGLAISLSVVLGLIEVLTDFGLPVFAVRKSTALSSPRAMASLQSLTLIRAGVLALVLLLLSPLMAHVFGGTASPWPYALLGLIALLRGFENLGVKELMRQYVFWREALVIASAQTLGLIVTIAAVLAGSGMLAIVWGMTATAAITVLLSHLLSPVPYRLAWERDTIAEANAFGRPLLINGLAVAFGTSDRLLVGSLLGPVTLALYNVAYGTAALPRSVLTRFLNNAFLPLFVERRDRGHDPTPLLDSWALCLSVLALVYGLALCLIGDRLLGLVFGATYQPSRLFMGLAALSVAVKFLMLLPGPAAYAAGTTRFISAGSLLSAASILPAALSLALFRNLDLFLLVAVATEFAGLLVLMRLALRQFSFTPAIVVSAIAIPFLLLGGLAAIAFMAPQLDFIPWLGAGAVALVLGLLAYALAWRLLGLARTPLPASS